MSRTVRLITLCAIVCHATAALASNCDEVYKNSTRNKYYSESDAASLNTVYDQLCDTSGEKKSLSWDSSMSIVVDALPINMTGNGKSTSEKADSFCHYYHNVRFDTSHSALAKDEVVVSAPQSYNACREIEEKA